MLCTRSGSSIHLDHLDPVEADRPVALEYEVLGPITNLDVENTPDVRRVLSGPPQRQGRTGDRRRFELVVQRAGNRFIVALGVSLSRTSSITVSRYSQYRSM